MRFWKALWNFQWGMAAIGAGILLFAMMMITVTSVFGRYVLHADIIPGAYNIVERIIFPLIVFWALPIAHREGMFPRLEGVTDSLRPMWRSAIAVFVLAVEIAIYAIVLWYVTRFVWTSIENHRTMQIGTDVYVLWPIIIFMPLAFGFMLIEMVRLLVEDFRLIMAGKPVEEHHMDPTTGAV